MQHLRYVYCHRHQQQGAIYGNPASGVRLVDSSFDRMEKPRGEETTLVLDIDGTKLAIRWSEERCSMPEPYASGKGTIASAAGDMFAILPHGVLRYTPGEWVHDNIKLGRSWQRRRASIQPCLGPIMPSKGQATLDHTHTKVDAS